jgi:electron transport complex protein RnfC
MPTTARPTFARGIHPPEHKEMAASEPIEVLPTPAQVTIPLLQHLGAPCVAKVKPREEVSLGEEIGEATGFVSAPVHASISGKIGRATNVTLPNGRHVPAITIAAAERQPIEGHGVIEELLDGHWPIGNLAHYEPAAIREAARTAGLVGLGGAAFPTHVKLTPNDDKPIDTLLINGCECEPYLSADDRLMRDHPQPILSGAVLAARAAGAGRIIVGIEDNKADALESMLDTAMLDTAADSAIEVIRLRTKYPQGGEKQLIAAALGREVPTGRLPLDVGVVVMNVSTAAALARAVLRGGALTHRLVTVSGSGIRRPANVLVPIGTPYQALIDHCGGVRDDAVRIVAGGPMMGFTLGSLDVPVTKGTSGVTVLRRDEIRPAEVTPCVRCGRCVEVCPMRLVPTKLALASRCGNTELARRYHIAACIECGCCAYTCPARIPLVQLIRMGKVMMK